MNVPALIEFMASMMNVSSLVWVCFFSLWSWERMIDDIAVWFVNLWLGSELRINGDYDLQGLRLLVGEVLCLIVPLQSRDVSSAI